MKIKLDENIPQRVKSVLIELGHQVDTVAEEKLIGAVDDRIWLAAQTEGRFLITQDLDFSNIQKFTPGTHAGILVVRLANGGREALMRRIEQVFRSEAIEGWKGCFVVLTERKIRVRRPAG